MAASNAKRPASRTVTYGEAGRFGGVPRGALRGGTGIRRA
ncbi:hypothetical protein K701_17605 [Streptomyces fradiae ATCC 10745 = DSM 40063]|uniref:Uncharacterized protein n=1 Tax=Streptomyces fradiae ATCC 10745 = DSM 40063 TaxID=1319510 RepID=A0ABQ6XS77_STRFR|nr:hypothetical protein K701_17605 [Streptomyces fradiae ATCC 10745 = DSM 40063]